MSILKKGDRVEVIGPSSGGDRGFVGLRGPITDTPFEARPGMMAAMLDIPQWGSARLFPVTSLRLLPVLKAGDRVLVKATGKEDAIVRVWHSEGVADVYELADEFCDADELELVRQPKAGEVWENENGLVLLRTPEQIPGWVVLLGRHTGSLLRYRDDPLTFAAESPAAYFKARQ